MKKLATMFFFMMFISIVGYSQAVPEKANTIVVTVADSNSAKNNIMSVLNERGYTLRSGKASPSIISTADRTLKNDARVNYSFQLKGKEVIVTGRLPVAGQAGTPIAFKGNKGTPMMKGWEEMDKIAKELGGSIKYEVR